MATSTLPGSGQDTLLALMQDNASLSYLALSFISRDLNDEISLVKTIKEALQKIPTVEIVIIMKYNSNWFIFYLYLSGNIRRNCISILL